MPREGGERGAPSLSELGEFGLVDRLAAHLAAGEGSPRVGSIELSIGDDAAVLGLPADTRLVATADALAEGVHFRRDWSAAEDVGWKAIAVNVSDLGAMGGRPVGALLTLALPRDTPVAWVDSLYEGVSAASDHFGCPVVGGDTVRSLGGICLSVTALGAVPSGRAVSRSGARVGDLVCVTGGLGDSGAGLALLERGGAVPSEFTGLVNWHLRPTPPVEAGAVLGERGQVTSMMDLSDGLASDVRHIAARSGAGVEIDADRLPISDAAREAAKSMGLDPVRWAMFGGEDYQLLFTVSPDQFSEIPPALAPLGVVATIVGRITTGGIMWIAADGSRRSLVSEGFHHFH